MALLQRAYGIVEKAGPDPQPEYALVTRNNLATLYGNEGRNDDAERLLKESVAYAEKTLGTDDDNVAMAQANLGLFYLRHARYDEAQPLIEGALQRNQKAWRPDDLRLLSYQDAAGALYAKQHKFDQAESLLERSRTMEEKAGSRADASRAFTLSEFGALYAEKGDVAQSEAFYQQAIALARTAYPEGGAIAAMKGDLAAVYVKAGRYDDAAPLLAAAIAEEEKAIGMDATHLTKDLRRLAIVYRHTGHDEKARTLDERAANMGARIH